MYGTLGQSRDTVRQEESSGSPENGSRPRSLYGRSDILLIVSPEGPKKHEPKQFRSGTTHINGGKSEQEDCTDEVSHRTLTVKG